MDSETIDLSKMFYSLRRRFALLVILAFAGLILSGLYSFISKKQYTADVMLYVWDDNLQSENGDVRYDDLVLYSALINDYRVLAKSRLIINEVAKELNLDKIATNKLSKKIEISTIENTRQLIISVTDTDPVFAATVANMTASVFSTFVVDKIGAASVRIIDDAIVPLEPSNPNRIVILAIGLLAGLMLGVGIVILPDLLDKRIKTSHDIEQLTGFSELGLIPRLESFKSNIHKDESDENASTEEGAQHLEAGLLAHINPSSQVSEVYNTARTTIEFATSSLKLKTINITSSQPLEGKSITITHLAISYAQSGHRVLLIDVNLNHPNLHRLFDLPNDHGLTTINDDLNVHTDGPDQFVHVSSIPNLSVITSGPIPPNSAEVLMSKTMWSYIGKLERKFDMIFLDGPSLGHLKDAEIISSKVNGTIFVVRSGSVNKARILRAAERLRNSNARVIGFILNETSILANDESFYEQNRHVRDQKVKP